MANLNKTQIDVLNYIKEKTKRFKEADSQIYTANYLAGQLNISRNSASQYLNEFAKDGIFLKTNSRPVYFFDVEVLETLYQIKIDRSAFMGVSELAHYLESTAGKKKNFEKAIGYDAGLSYEVAQCRMAMEYPPQGLPMLLAGQNGTGKSLLAQLSWEYAADKGLLEDKKNSFYVFRSLVYAGEPETAKRLLFGQNGEDGLLKQAENGVLYVKDVHMLGREIQDQLSAYLDSRRIIFSTTQNVPENLSRQLLQKIPVFVRIPALESRSIAEKERLIIYYFKKESDRIKRNIRISRRVLDALLNYSYANNISQLKSSIQTCCISAYQLEESSHTALSVNAIHLPENILQEISITEDFRSSNQEMLDVDELDVSFNSDREMVLYESLLKRYRSYEEGTAAFSDMMREGMRDAGVYFDYLIYEKNFSNEKIRAMETLLNEIFQSAADQYDISLTSNFAMILARMIYSGMRSGGKAEQLDAPMQKLADGCFELLVRKCPQEMMVATEISGMILKNLEWEITRLQMILIIMKLNEHQGEIRGIDTRAMIICHGYSTASSIADVVNQTLGKKVFDAMDMPMDTNISVIADKAGHYIESCGAKNVILLVDLGSLETIDSLMRRQLNVNLGIINNVSTRLALDIGGKMLMRMGIADILEKAGEACPISYQLIAEQKKEEAILFVSELNSDVAEKVSKLFMNSLPRKIEIHLMCYEYSALQNYKNSIMNQYHILFVAGTVNPMFPDTPFVYLEDIISFNKIDTVKMYLEGYLDEEEREQFHRNLLKNFSLQNVIEYLTILNADKVLEFVDETLEQLQIALGRRFSAKTIIGLNIHICCLVERLVTKTPFTSHLNEKEFQTDQKEFIDAVILCFRNITSHYGVELPISEIAYIYDYIYHD